MRIARFRRALLCACAPLAFLAACGGPLETVDKQPLSELKVIRVAGFDREYYIVPPAQAAGNPARPLLLVYHGAGGSALDLMNGTRLAIEGHQAGMVVVFLEAVDGYGARWATNPVDLAVVDDLQFTREVVDEIDEEFPIDRKRVFAVGYSRGGDLVFQLACRAPDFLRGGAAVAATMLNSNRAWCDETASSTVQPAIAMVLGSQDPLMPWDGGLAIRMGALETSSYWGQRNGCRTSAATSLTLPAYQGYRLSRYTIDPCTRADVHLYRIEPVGHSWPNTAFDLDGTLVRWFSSLAARP
jgi:polyhydroxybutyrate depolymerase